MQGDFEGLKKDSSLLQGGIFFVAFPLRLLVVYVCFLSIVHSIIIVNQRATDDYAL